MLPADQRLRHSRDFRTAYARGRSCVLPGAVLYSFHRNTQDMEHASGRRIGFVVSKKQGGAVVRNRMKRRLREAVRLRLSDLSEGSYDLIFVGRGALKSASWTEIQATVDTLLRRAGMLRESR